MRSGWTEDQFGLSLTSAFGVDFRKSEAFVVVARLLVC